MIFLSSDSQIAYYHAPKNGSRTMLGYLALTKEPDLYEKNPKYFHPIDDEVYEPLRERVQRYGSHHYSSCTVPVFDSPIRLAIKRDPIKRFVSGYTNRVLHHKKVTTLPSIAEFIEGFDEYYERHNDVQTHFRPQVEFFGKDKSIYTHIFDTSEMHLVRELFEDTYGRKFPDLRLQQGGNKNKITLTEEQEEWIRDRYADDYTAGWY